MILNTHVTTRLLRAIEADTLMFLCGAGLSIPPPSYLLSAIEVSRICYDRWLPMEVLNPAFRDDIGQIAGYFHSIGEFERVFIRQLVPWNDLVGRPNNGHAAIADFLISRGAHAALSANFDCLIETWAEAHKIALQGALTGRTALDTVNANPLIKFHGCLRARESILWTQAQLADTEIRTRVASCSEWMNLHLPGKDLVVVGFWSDWRYLNDVFASAFAIDTASSVTVIDPSPTADLQDKAPNLWEKLNGLSRVFEHVKASGADALEELRTAYSKVWARKYYLLGETALANATGGAVTAVDPFDALSGEDLYNLRRDAEGASYTRAATLKAPAANAAQAAFFYVMLLNVGATQQGALLQYGGRLVRVVNGAGQGLTDVQARYKEPPTVLQPDIVVCAGAAEYGVPGRLIAPGRGASVIRPAPGGDSMWLTLEKAREVLSL